VPIFVKFLDRIFEAIGNLIEFLNGRGYSLTGRTDRAVWGFLLNCKGANGKSTFEYRVNQDPYWTVSAQQNPQWIT